MKNKIIQFSLLIAGITLFFFTYYSGNKEEIVDINKNILTENVGKLTEETSNIIENASYTGTNNKGVFFKLNAAVAEVKYNKPNISQLQDVLVVIKLSDLRTIHIRSDRAMFNKITNDCEFFGHVKITEQDNIITSDNLNLQMSESLITAFSNVHYRNFRTKSFVLADKVKFDMITNTGEIFMEKPEDKVKVKYIN